MNKKILIYATHFHPYKGGLENFALSLATRFAKRGHSVNIFTYNLDNLKEIEKYKGVNIYRLPCITILGRTYTLPKFGKTYSELLENVLNQKYDAVFTNTRFFTTSWLGAAYMKRVRNTNKSAKFYHIEHGNVHVIHKNPIVTALAWIYDQSVGRYIFRKADKVIGISTPCADFAKKLGAKKTTVIYNSIDTKQFKQVNTNLKQKLNIKKEDFVVINGIGRLIYAKGLQDTYEAVKNMKNVFVITIGEGPFEENLKDLAKKLDVKTKFTGRLNTKEIIEYLSIADIFINPSYSEGLPTCVLEAGAMGLPVIATDVGGTKEIIKNKKNGWLINPKDIQTIKNLVDEIIKNRADAKKKGENLKKHIKTNFDWNKNIKRFEELL
ncbi:glycosyltransferase family 4 protein [Candidatus Woesearchaeota archaeon]|nr:glycosyltransferase family 4 protein [Candidatus Woesearchaeota archaeon]